MGIVIEGRLIACTGPDFTFSNTEAPAHFLRSPNSCLCGRVGDIMKCQTRVNTGRLVACETTGDTVMTRLSMLLVIVCLGRCAM